jgi:hypothetical protein
MKARHAASAALITSLCISAPLAAQRGGGNYDPTTEVSFAGAVEEVRTVPAPARGPGGLHLIVRTNESTAEVHVGPITFARSRSFEFAVGDAISVTGSKVEIGGAEVILAREITKGDQVLTLRDPQGFPLWSGRMQRSP